MSTEQVAILSGAVVGIVGILAPALTAKRDREHRRELAQAERHHQLRADVYARAGGFLERQRLVVYRTEPFMGPTMPAPDPLPDSEWTALEGSIAVASSIAVRTAIGQAHQRGNEFVLAVFEYRGDAEGAGAEMQAARQRALDAVDEAERVMRDELAGL
jgi:hypothetical protein